MELRLSEEQIELLQTNISAEELEEALTIMLLEAGQTESDLDELEGFCRAVRDCGGDLSKLLFRTHEPVDIETFITDKYFLGYKIIDDVGEDDDKHQNIGIWRPLFDDIKTVIEGGYTEIVEGGAIGIGKTTKAQIVLAYDIYRLSCEAYPQLRFGLLPGFSIQQVCMNVNEKLAKRVTYGQYSRMIDRIRYFKEHFPRKKDNESEMLFPKGIRVNYCAAYSAAIMGENTIGGVVDELNFMSIIKESKKKRDEGEFDQAVEVYTGLSRRLKSRYDVGEDDNLPSHLFLVSSKGYPGDFTEKRIKEIKEANDGRSIAFAHRQWEVKKRRIFKTQPWFLVEVGNDRHNTRILKKKDEPRKKAKIVKVPKFYLDDFKKDPEGALRDFAGESTVTITPFFGDRERVWEMSDIFAKLGMVAPFMEHVIDLKKGLPQLNPDYEVVNPSCPRAAHIDLAVTRDYCGISIGHVYKTDFVRRRNKKTDRLATEELPFVAYDLVFTIKPPKGGEIEFTEVRNIIYLLRDLGLPVKWVTFDGYQSRDSRQMMRKKGFKTGELSVEKIEPYEDFKQAVYEGRCAAYEHVLAFTELCKLEADYKAKKIDHLPNESKDTADSMCGVYTSLVSRRSAWRAMASTEEDDEDTKGEPLIVESGFKTELDRRATERVRNGSQRRDGSRRDVRRR